jgi:hypothetical protein
MNNFILGGLLVAVIAVNPSIVSGETTVCGDHDASGEAGASDALRLLRFAVGQQVTLQCPSSGTPALRKYYLTPTGYAGNQTLTACAAGYHMGSFGEIKGLSDLSYDTSRGYMADDSGFGPPQSAWGWIRTGFPGASSNFIGANCSAGSNTVWASDGDTSFGTIMQIRPDLPSQTGSGYVVQDAVVLQTLQCSYGGYGVWCVQD